MAVTDPPPQTPRDWCKYEHAECENYVHDNKSAYVDLDYFPSRDVCAVTEPGRRGGKVFSSGIEEIIPRIYFNQKMSFLLGLRKWFSEYIWFRKCFSVLKDKMSPKGLFKNTGQGGYWKTKHPKVPHVNQWPSAERASASISEVKNSHPTSHLWLSVHVVLPYLKTGYVWTRRASSSCKWKAFTQTTVWIVHVIAD